ncbi:MAG: type IX secretion system membrane protein PorP/SprF [Ferruginibacter sp.]
MSKFKSILVSALVTAFLHNALMAQQKPHYTQYVLNNYILNPALSGIENYTDIKISHRHQWAGLTDAPVTTYLSIQGPLGKKDYKTNPSSFAMPGENPRGRNYWKDYEPSKPHHGVGMQLIDDRTGPLGNFSIYGTYAYHIGINATTNLSAGIGIGMSKFSVNASKLNFGPTNPIDPAVYGSGVLGKSRLDMNIGLWLYSSDFFAGLSAMQLIPSKIDFSNNIVKLTEGKKVPHLFASAGYRFLLNEDINVLPSVMIKYVQPLPLQAEVNVKFQYQDLVWAGASYRYKYGFAAMLGVNVLNSFNMSYSYDYSTTRLNTISSGTHEIMLGFIIGNKYSADTCPRNVW